MGKADAGTVAGTWLDSEDVLGLAGRLDVIVSCTAERKACADDVDEGDEEREEVGEAAVPSDSFLGEPVLLLRFHDGILVSANLPADVPNISAQQIQTLYIVRERERRAQKMTWKSRRLMLLTIRHDSPIC